jgi:hypothetical protein
MNEDTPLNRHDHAVIVTCGNGWRSIGNASFDNTYIEQLSALLKREMTVNFSLPCELTHAFRDSFPLRLNLQVRKRSKILTKAAIVRTIVTSTLVGTAYLQVMVLMMMD